MQFRFDATTITVNVPHAAALLTAVKSRLVARQGFALATINLDHLVKLKTSAAFRAAYAAQDLVVADGNPIVWLSRLARRPVDLVPGSDMVLPLARVAAQTGRKVALVGTTEAALHTAADAMRAAIPGLDIALTIAPPMGFDPQSAEAAALLKQLEAADIGLAFLALGAPKQEALAARGRELAPHVGFASIGAGLDFLAGTQQRAPDWVRRIAMEWAWRMASNPGRLVPRYWACFKLLPGEAVKAITSRG
ncbi:WecB/TagA/CpsF family glycosyltransferase [Gemmobacter serpentinus]|uniref:WecB/TagA/CpsF family glycosyltransferase n=1 Tax=Gemmobacter serpentinus TaxID=2652247 RepID=UPI00124C33CF|nr:WecB/TagA/CpsF family glycosyltransferase [Gemmobacter serpentinus]